MGGRNSDFLPIHTNSSARDNYIISTRRCSLLAQPTLRTTWFSKGFSYENQSASSSLDLSYNATSNYSEEEPLKKQASTRLSTLLLSLTVATCLLGGTFYLGMVFDQWVSPKTYEEIVAENALRDELMLSQEKLLVEFARSQSRLVSTEIISESEKQHGTRIESDETQSLLSRHLELLQKELAQQSYDLSEERKSLNKAADEVKQAWGSYQLFTSQVEAERHAIEKDLRVLFEKLTVDEFGPGPHFVQFQLLLSRNITSEEDDMFSYFTIEIESEKVAPTSVFFFLKQISLGLWSGPTFYFNDGRTLSTDMTHTVSAGALTSALSAKLMNTKNSLAQKLASNAKKAIIPIEKMISKGLGHLPFPEDSDNALPQSEYTVCFKPNDGIKGRPGPAIYINQVENDGQPSCFGTVIIGRDVIDRVGQMKGPPHDPNYLKKPIRIISALILDKLDDAVGADRYIAEQHKKFKEEM